MSPGPNLDEDLLGIIEKKYEIFLVENGFHIATAKERPRFYNELRKVFTGGYQAGAFWIIEKLQEEMRKPVSKRETLELIETLSKIEPKP